MVAHEPARYTLYLATSLTNLANAFCELGRHDEELDLRAEAAVRWRILSQLDPDEHEESYQRERDRLTASYSQHEREPDEAWRAEENLVHRLGLGISPPKHST